DGRDPDGRGRGPMEPGRRGLAAIEDGPIQRDALAHLVLSHLQLLSLQAIQELQRLITIVTVCHGSTPQATPGVLQSSLPPQRGYSRSRGRPLRAKEPKGKSFWRFETSCPARAHTWPDYRTQRAVRSPTPTKRR